jgi:hypothetical protein
MRCRRYNGAARGGLMKMNSKISTFSTASNIPFAETHLIFILFSRKTRKAKLSSFAFTDSG